MFMNEDDYLDARDEMADELEADMPEEDRICRFCEFWDGNPATAKRRCSEKNLEEDNPCSDEMFRATTEYRNWLVDDYVKRWGPLDASEEEINGVRPGIDFPWSLTRY